MFSQACVILFTGGCLPLCMLGYHPLPGSRPLGVEPPSAEHAGRYGQCAGGTHPTGMQSCWHVREYKSEVMIFRKMNKINLLIMIKIKIPTISLLLLDTKFILLGFRNRLLVKCEYSSKEKKLQIKIC